MMKKLLLLLVGMVSVLSLMACEGINFNIGNPDEEEQARFNTIMDILENYHYSEPSQEDLWQGAIQGMIDTLDDPFSSYYTEEEYEQFQQSLGESFVGVGVTVENMNDDVVIQRVWQDSPAERAGLRAGDRITYVDGDNVEGLSYLETLMLVQGEEGSTVELGIARSGVDETLFMEMTREEIPNPTVTYEIFEDGNKTIGYISVNSFGHETFEIFEATLNDLEESGIEGLIIDLRDNSGGRLDTVVQMMDLFLIESDKPLFATETFESGEVNRTEYDATGDEKKPYDIITVINEFSASASEVFAAAMKQHGEYDVYGLPSFGKGTMQTPFSHRNMNNDELHLSNGIWLTPNNTWINNIGGDQESLYPTREVKRSEAFDIQNLYILDDPLTYDTVDSRTESLQKALNALYAFDLRTDGYFDEATKEAVKTFQETYDLTVSGEVDFDTASTLNENLIAFRNDYANDLKIQTALETLND